MTKRLEVPSPGDDNVAQLKNDIDSGLTGDKVATGDPGLSALGTDDEAGGNSPTTAQVALARQQESDIGRIARGNRRSLGKEGQVWPIVLMIGVAALMILGVLVQAIFFR